MHHIMMFKKMTHYNHKCEINMNNFSKKHTSNQNTIATIKISFIIDMSIDYIKYGAD